MKRMYKKYKLDINEMLSKFNLALLPDREGSYFNRKAKIRCCVVLRSLSLDENYPSQYVSKLSEFNKIQYKCFSENGRSGFVRELSNVYRNKDVCSYEKYSDKYDLNLRCVITKLKNDYFSKYCDAEEIIKEMGEITNELDDIMVKFIYRDEFKLDERFDVLNVVNDTSKLNDKYSSIHRNFVKLMKTFFRYLHELNNMRARLMVLIDKLMSSAKKKDVIAALKDNVVISSVVYAHKNGDSVEFENVRTIIKFPYSAKPSECIEYISNNFNRLKRSLLNKKYGDNFIETFEKMGIDVKTVGGANKALDGLIKSYFNGNTFLINPPREDEDLCVLEYTKSQKEPYVFSMTDVTIIQDIVRI